MKEYIIQFSPIRSGSTLVYKLISNTVDLPVHKHHHLTEVDPEAFYIVTIRHPYNSIISSILRYSGSSITDENLEEHVAEYLNHGGSVISKDNFPPRDSELLFYENFVDNFELIYQAIEKASGSSISRDKQKELNKQFNIKRVKEACEQLKETGPDSYEFTSEYKGKHVPQHWHPWSVSKNLGETDYKNFLNSGQIDKLKENKQLSRIINRYYEKL